MADTQEPQDSGLLEAFDLSNEEVFEAKRNLLGFFDVLYKIDQRLKREAEGNEKEGDV